MNRRICALLLVVLLLCAASCAPDAAVLYEDHIDELDIGGRINDNARRIETHTLVAYARGDLETMIEDLNALAPEEPAIERINRAFIRVAELLLLAAQAQDEQNEEAMERYFSDAQRLYANANRQLNQYKRGSGADAAG